MVRTSDDLRRAWHSSDFTISIRASFKQRVTGDDPVRPLQKRSAIRGGSLGALSHR